MSDNALVFVANNNVYDQTVAFLESVHQNSPGIPLVCIPYDKEISLISELSNVYDFSFYEDFDFRAFMELWRIMIGRPLARLRKLGAFTYPAEEFMSLDTDIIVLQDLRPVFGHVGPGGAADILHFDLSPNMTYWDRTDPLIAHSKEINTGAFVSSRRIFSYERHVTTIMSHYTKFKKLAVMENDDQPFGSFVFDVEGRRYASIETVCDFSEHTWYKKAFSFRDGVLVETESGRRVPLIHFAGVTRAEGYASAECFRELALHYQQQGLARVAKSSGRRQGAR